MPVSELATDCSLPACSAMFAVKWCSQAPLLSVATRVGRVSTANLAVSMSTMLLTRTIGSRELQHTQRVWRAQQTYRSAKISA